jgi:hypothetical protein
VQRATSGDHASPKVLVDETLTLDRGAAVDVDQPGGPVAADHQEGATDGYDLYHGPGIYGASIEAVNAPNVYFSLSALNPSSAYLPCRDAITSREPSPSMQVMSAYATGQFCFRTSDRHVAIAIVNKALPDGALVLRAVVWAGSGV